MCENQGCENPDCTVAYGSCHCGCGEPAPVSTETRSNLGWYRGEPKRFINGHHLRGGGAKHPSWKGGRTMTKSGYWLVAVAKDHPMADANSNVYEHRLVMYEKLGRPLLRSEHVHHKNGDRTDNRPENLELLTGTDHMRKNSKLSVADVAVIRRRLLNGEMQSELASAYGVSSAAISFIATGKSWRGVEAA